MWLHRRWACDCQGAPPSDDVGMPVSVTVGQEILRVTVPILDKTNELPQNEEQ
jgi:hypothetical protein